MKKRLICCGALCLMLVLFCGAAMADDAPVITVDPAYSSTVEVKYAPKGEDAAFTVEKNGLDSGTAQLYLLLIQQGASTSESAKPTKDNVFYLDVQPSSGSTVSFDAYPKQMDAGTYVVYLSDYSSGSNGALKGVALITISSSGINILYGDADGNGTVNRADRTLLARYIASETNTAFEAVRSRIVLENCDLNNSGAVDRADRTILARHIAAKDGNTSLARFLTLPVA